MQRGERDWERDEFDEDPDPDDPQLAPVWFPGGHLPPDAKAMGLTHHVPDGALLDFAGRLDSTKPVHRFTAWTLLLVLCLPLAMHVVRIAQWWLGD
ncbi:hypothetical protein [Nocardioides nanhaiensis]|uniref:DUF1353 domain-containing protein n=1 Tax=Nocardioides nanhaiensis TaxID=1476871 RepID=A0ABP8WR67_9ACTN